MRAGQNASKPLCPVFNSSAVPAIRPVALPDITSLSGGQILVGPQQLPTQIKVRAHVGPLKSEIKDFQSKTTGGQKGRKHQSEHAKGVLLYDIWAMSERKDRGCAWVVQKPACCTFVEIAFPSIIELQETIAATPL